MSEHVVLSEKSILRAIIAEDQKGEWGLYIVPGDSEICITEDELQKILSQIKDLKT